MFLMFLIPGALAQGSQASGGLVVLIGIHVFNSIHFFLFGNVHYVFCGAMYLVEPVGCRIVPKGPSNKYIYIYIYIFFSYI